MSQDFHRATLSLTTEGRQLLGIAAPYDRPAMAFDLDRPTEKYLEAFSPVAFVRTLEQRPEGRPLFWYHAYLAGPADAIGFSEFLDSRSENALLFRATVSRTHKGDETLELVKSGAATGASIGGRILQSSQKWFPEGVAAYRLEVALRELSIAPTGMQIYEDARVLAVRAQPKAERPGEYLARTQAYVDAQNRRIDATLRELRKYGH